MLPQVRGPHLRAVESRLEVLGLGDIHRAAGSVQQQGVEGAHLRGRRRRERQRGEEWQQAHGAQDTGDPLTRTIHKPLSLTVISHRLR